LRKPIDASDIAPDKVEDITNFTYLKNNQKSLIRVESKNSVTYCMDIWECDVMEDHDVDSFLGDFLHGKTRYRQTQKTNDISAKFLDQLSRVFIKNLCNEERRPILSRYQLDQLLKAYPDRPVQCVLASKTVNMERPSGSYKLPETSLIEVLNRLQCVIDFHKFEDKAMSLRAMLDLYQTNKSVLEEARVDNSILSLLEVTSKMPSMSTLGYQILDREDLMWQFEAFFSRHLSKDDDKTTVEEKAFNFASQLSDSLGRGFVSRTQVDRYLSGLFNESMEATAEKAHTLLRPIIIPEPPTEPDPEPEEEFVYEWLESIFSDAGNEDTGKQLASKYGKNFKEQGLVTLNDLKVGRTLDNATLAEVLGIPKLGHRLRIIAAHEEMLKPGIKM